METTAVQSVKLAIVAATGLSKDALHIYIGLLVFLGSALALRKPLKSWLPWLAVLGVALAGEFVDAVDDIHSIGHWRWAASVHDIINTMVWPTALMLLARFTRLLGSGNGRVAA